MTSYKNEVYYSLNSNNSISEIKKTIRFAEQVWHSLVVLTCTESQLPLTLSKPILNNLIEKTRFIIVSAYDGEGYVYWEKI